MQLWPVYITIFKTGVLRYINSIRTGSGRVFMGSGISLKKMRDSRFDCSREEGFAKRSGNTGSPPSRPCTYISKWKIFRIPVCASDTLLGRVCPIWTEKPNRTDVPSHTIQGHWTTCSFATVPSRPTFPVWTCQGHTIAHLSWWAVDAFWSTGKSPLIAISPVRTGVGIRIKWLLGAEIPRRADPSVLVTNAGVIQVCCIVKCTVVLQKTKKGVALRPSKTKKLSVCSDEGLMLETSAKHHIPQATNIPYQPLLIKPIFSVLAHAENSFFQN